MSLEDLAEFHRAFIEDVRMELEEGEHSHFEAALTQHAIEYLEEFGICEGLDPGYLDITHKRRPIRVDAAGRSDDGMTVGIVVTKHFNTDQPSTLYRSDVERLLKAGQNFALDAISGEFRKWPKLEGNLGVQKAEEIHKGRDEIVKVIVVVATDGRVPKEVPWDLAPHNGLNFEFQVLDIERFHLAVGSRGQEPIRVKFAELGAPDVAVLSSKGSPFPVYLGILTGDLLATVYDRFGQRLMESNVRSFLQARGEVNKGIRDTILNKPDMFLTYNNGIACTATGVETAVSGNQEFITAIDGFQIVNGGQTTASLFHAKYASKRDLAAVQVPMKLTVISEPDMAEMIVPNISRFSNTQNAVNIADFASNDPFHVAVEKASAAIPVPSRGKEATYWFYERARGQYDEQRNKEKTPARRKKWTKSHPTSQRIRKTEAAKYLNAWDQLPHIVSLGAQKNFNQFSVRIKERPVTVTDDFFKQLVAKAILFKAVDRAVLQHLGGTFKINIVAYTVALFSARVNGALPWSTIWQTQLVPERIIEQMVAFAKHIQPKIAQPSDPKIKHPGEWAKKHECWDEIRNEDLPLDADFMPFYDDLVKKNRPAESPTDFSKSEGTIQPLTWIQLARWGSETGKIERKALFDLRKWASPVRIRKGALRFDESDAIKLLEQARLDGFVPE